MSITIQIPGSLKNYCGGATELTVFSPTVRAMLEYLETEYPSLYRNICDETGKVRRNVNIFVNVSHMRDREGLDTPLVPGDVVSIIPAVSGG